MHNEDYFALLLIWDVSLDIQKWYSCAQFFTARFTHTYFPFVLSFDLIFTRTYSFFTFVNLPPSAGLFLLFSVRPCCFEQEVKKWLSGCHFYGSEIDQVVS